MPEVVPETTMSPQLRDVPHKACQFAEKLFEWILAHSLQYMKGSQYMKKLDSLWLDPYVRAFTERMTHKHFTGYEISWFCYLAYIFTEM